MVLKQIQRFLSFSALLLIALVAMPRLASALSFTNAFKAPLTTPYVECGTELATTDCTSGSMELASPWTFSRGAIEIDDDEVSLRLDDLQIRPGLNCDTDVGLNACNCWDNNSGNCTTTCTAPNKCGPDGSVDGADNNYFVVKIFMQDKYDYFGTEKIRRDTNCHPEIQFDLKNINGSNQNRQVNQTVSTIIEGCGVFSSAHGVEIRHVVVEDKHGNIVAKVSH